MIVSWAIGEITYFIFEVYSGWGCDYDSFLGYWGNNLVYFWDYSGWGCDYDSFLGYWGNNLVYF